MTHGSSVRKPKPTMPPLDPSTCTCSAAPFDVAIEDAWMTDIAQEETPAPVEAMPVLVAPAPPRKLEQVDAEDLARIRELIVLYRRVDQRREENIADEARIRLLIRGIL